MNNLLNGNIISVGDFKPPHPNWADKQKELYLKMCIRRKELFSRRGQNGKGLLRQIKEAAQKEGLTFSDSTISFFFSGRTYNSDILRIFNKIADEKEKEYI